MRNELSQWKKRIDDCPLPILKSTAQFFSRQRAKPGASISCLSDHLQYDMGMCLNLLRAAGRCRRVQVTTINHAVLLLGLPNTLNRPEHLPKIEDVKQPEIKNLLLSHCYDTHHAYSLAKFWMDKENSSIGEEIQTACLVSGFIDYLLCNADPERYLKLIKTERQGVSRTDAEQNVLGVLRRELAYEIASDWHLPELVIESQKHGQNQSHSLRQVYLCQRMQEELSNGWYHEGMQKVLQQIADFTHQPIESVSSTMHQQSADICRKTQKTYFPITGAASRLVECDAAPPVKANAIPIKNKTTRRDILKHCIEEIHDNNNLTLQQIIKECFNGFCNGLGLQRVFFAQLTEDGKHLKVSTAIDLPGKEGLNRFRVPLNNNNLFEQLMRQPGGVWMNDANQKKYRPFLPKQFIDEIHSEHFLAMSVFIHDNAFGMFYADNAKEALTEGHFKYFKRLCRVTTEAIESLSDHTNKPKQVAHA